MIHSLKIREEALKSQSPEEGPLIEEYAEALKKAQTINDTKTEERCKVGMAVMQGERLFEGFVQGIQQNLIEEGRQNTRQGTISEDEKLSENRQVIQEVEHTDQGEEEANSQQEGSEEREPEEETPGREDHEKMMEEVTEEEAVEQSAQEEEVLQLQEDLPEEQDEEFEDEFEG